MYNLFPKVCKEMKDVTAAVPLRKWFDLSSPFPFNCNYRQTKHTATELPDHLHDWYEIVYVHRGEGTFFIDRTLYGKQEGDLFIIPSNTIHRSFSDESNPINSTALFFSGAFVQQPALGDAFPSLRCFEHAKKGKTYRLRLAEKDGAQLERLIDELHAELEEGLPGHRQAVHLQLQRILLQINRTILPPEGVKAREAAGRGPTWMNRVLHRIDEKPEDDLTLSALARSAAVTPAHFSRVFKQLTGLNVTEYVTAKRIVRAKELLQETEDGVGEIAERCGFRSLPHFHRMFKRLTGVTPAGYKRSFLTD